MIGKIYVTPTSTPEKLQSVYELVGEVLQLKIAPDATTRNALTKLHTALGKAVGETATKPSRKSSMPEEVTVADEDDGEAEQTVLADTNSGNDIKMEDVGEEEATEVKDSLVEEGLTNVKDSILDELLDDEEEEV